MEPNAKVPNWVILELQGHPTDSQTPRTTAAPPDASRFPSGPAGGALDCLLTRRNPGRGRTPSGDPPQLGFVTPSAQAPASALASRSSPPRPLPSHLRTALLPPPLVKPPVASADSSEQVALRVQPRGPSGNGRRLQPAAWWGAPIGQRAQGRRRDWPGFGQEGGNGVARCDSALAGGGRRGARPTGLARSDAQRTLTAL